MFFLNTKDANDTSAVRLWFRVLAEHPRSDSSQYKNSATISPDKVSKAALSGLIRFFTYKNSNNNWKATRYEVTVFALKPFPKGK